MMKLRTTALALVVSACSNESSSPANSATGEASTGGTTTTATAGHASSSATEAAETDTGRQGIPAEPLPGDASRCPGAYTEQGPRPGLNRGFRVAEQDREFMAVFPTTGAGPHPVIVAFNGTDETGPDFVERARLQDFADRGFVVLAPSSNDNGTVWPVWDAMRQQDEDHPNVDMQLFDDLLACVAAHVELDRNRVYVVGHSAGGIMANHILRQRSELLAGGIVGSGVFSLTGSADSPDLDPMFVLVTWGGDDDALGGPGVPQFDFVEQASLASVFYEEEPEVGQANCHADVGHKWLDAINPFMAEALLQHPKGAPGTEALELPDLPTPDSECTTEPFVYEPAVVVECPASAPNQCQAACQLFGDCAVANATIAPVLQTQLLEIGFAGDDLSSCQGCIDNCTAWATHASDEAVLECMANARATATCGAGIEGAQPLIDAVNNCCEDQSESGYCLHLCEIIVGNNVAAGFFPACQALTGR